MRRENAIKPYSCSIQSKTSAQIYLIEMWFNETILEETMTQGLITETSSIWIPVLIQFRMTFKIWSIAQQVS